MNLEEALSQVHKGLAIYHTDTKLKVYKPTEKSQVKQSVFTHLVGDDWFTKVTLNTSPIEEQIVINDIYKGAFIGPGSMLKRLLPDDDNWVSLDESENYKLAKEKLAE